MEPEVEQILHEQHRYYEDRAPEYDDVWYRRGVYDLGPEGNVRWFEETALLEAAVDELDVSGAVLELAAGTGLFTRHLAPRARSMIAVDAATSALAINRERVGDPRVEYVHADLYDWEPPAGQRFDLIFFAFLVSHILPERFEEFWDRLADGSHPVAPCSSATTSPASMRADRIPESPSTTGRRSRIVVACRTGANTRS